MTDRLSTRTPSPATADDRSAGNRHVRADIQGFRGVAILIGVAYHATKHPTGGYVAFDMFFVISGFVISGMLLREHGAHGRIRFRAFYVRRFWRLAPALSVMVLVTLVAGVLALSPVGEQDVAVESGVASLTLVANLAIPRLSGSYFSPSADLNPFLHTWSLSLEEQVYLIFPALLMCSFMLVRRRSGGTATTARSTLMLPTTVLATVSLFLTVTSQTGHPVLALPLTLGGYYGPVTRVWEFLAGALLAMLIHDRSVAGSAPRLRAGAGWLGLGFLVVAVGTFDATTTYPGPLTMGSVAAVCTIIWAGASDGPAWGVTRFLRARPLTFLGDMSYSWYLWHWPAICFARAAGARPIVVDVVAVLTILPAYASYRWLELPVVERRFPRPQDSRRQLWRRARAVVIGPLGVAALVVVCVTEGYWSTSVRTMASADAPHLGEVEGCYQSSAGDPCVLQSGPTSGRIVLWGDSNAEQYSEPAVAIARSEHRQLTLAVRGVCPPLDAWVTPGAEVRGTETPQAARQVCRSFYEGTLQSLESGPPATVVLGFGSDYGRGRGVTISGPTARDAHSDPLSAFRAGLVSTLSHLRDHGDRVVVLQPIPPFLEDSSWGTTTCDLLTILRGACAVSEHESEAVADTAAVRRVVASTAARYGATVVDPVPVLCPDARCATSVDGVVAYRDQLHLSVAGALLEEGPLRVGLDRAADGRG